jgi:hypothetical protein
MARMPRVEAAFFSTLIPMYNNGFIAFEQFSLFRKSAKRHGQIMPCSSPGPIYILDDKLG